MESNTSDKEYLILGHLIKYNLYLLSKSIIFSSVFQVTSDADKSVELTNEIVDKLDLEKKRTVSE